MLDSSPVFHVWLLWIACARPEGMPLATGQYHSVSISNPPYASRPNAELSCQQIGTVSHLFTLAALTLVRPHHPFFDFGAENGQIFHFDFVVRPNEKRHLRLRPDYSRDPRSHRRRRQVDVVLGPAQAPAPPRDAHAAPKTTPAAASGGTEADPLRRPTGLVVTAASPGSTLAVVCDPHHACCVRSRIGQIGADAYRGFRPSIGLGTLLQGFCSLDCLYRIFDKSIGSSLFHSFHRRCLRILVILPTCSVSPHSFHRARKSQYGHT